MGIYIDDIACGKEKIKISFVNDVDDTTLSALVEYESSNILSSLNYEECLQTIPSPCSCSGGCTEITCSCFSLHGFAYVEGCLSEAYMVPNGKPIVECSSFCSCTEMCPNRVVQHGIMFPLQVFKTECKGFGIRTLVSIPKAAFVCEYAGEIICEEEARKRISSRKPSEPNYVFLLKEYSTSNVIKTFIDPTFVGNVGRYINHSCSPNLLVIPIRTESMIPKLCLFSVTNIPPLTELCYDYASQCSQNTNVLHSEGLPKISFKRCLCGSLNCLGYLPHEPDIFLE